MSLDAANLAHQALQQAEAWLATQNAPPWLADSAAFLQQSWNDGIWGVSYGAMATAAAVLATAFVLRGLFARWVLRLIRAAASRSRTPLDEALIDALCDPLKLVFIVIGIDMAVRVTQPPAQTQAFADQLVRSLLAVTVFWALHRLARLLRLVLKPLSDALTPAAIDWIVKSLQIVFLVVGAAAVLELWGVRVAPLLAGLGIFGVAIALGAQDLFKNLIAGIAVLMERRFRKGDWIQVEGVVEGVVEQINFRSTVVRRFDDSPVYVPNANFSDNAVVSFSRMTRRRIHWAIGLEYGATVDQLKRVRDRVESYLLNTPAFVKPPEASLFVHVENFSESSIDLMIYCFTRTTVWGEWLAAKEALALELKRIVESEGVGFAFPSQSLYAPGLEGVLADLADRGRPDTEALRRKRAQ